MQLRSAKFILMITLEDMALTTQVTLMNKLKVVYEHIGLEVRKDINKTRQHSAKGQDTSNSEEELDRGI